MSCGYVNSSRRFEQRYLLLNKGFTWSQKLEDEDASFLSKRRKSITHPNGATTQNKCFVNYDSTYANKVILKQRVISSG